MQDRLVPGEEEILAGARTAAASLLARAAESQTEE